MVDAVGHLPVLAVVIAAFPGDSVLQAELGIQRPHSQTFHPAQFLHGFAFHLHSGETHEEHGAGDLSAATFVGPGLGVEAGHVVGVIRRKAERVKAERLLTGPAHRRVALSAGLDRRVRHRGAGAEDERGNRGHGNAAEQAVGPDPFHAGIIDLQAAMFEIERSPAVLGGGEGFERRAFKEGHGVNLNQAVEKPRMTQRAEPQPNQAEPETTTDHTDKKILLRNLSHPCPSVTSVVKISSQECSIRMYCSARRERLVGCRASFAFHLLRKGRVQKLLTVTDCFCASLRPIQLRNLTSTLNPLNGL